MLLLALLVPWAAKAQTTVTIGEGTATSNSNPIGTYYNYSITEQLYTAEEIGTAGTISSISFYYMGIAAKNLPITVYMANVDAEDLTSGISLADADEVFSGTLPVTTTAGWVTINLATPFDYDGTSNLLIGFIKDYLYYFNGQSWQGTATTTAMARYSQSDSAGPYTTSTVPGTATNQRPNIQIEITPAGGSTCPKPDELTANGEPTDTEFSFTIEGGSGLYNIFTKAGNGDWTNWEYEWEETTVNLTNLESNTAYQVRVQSVCTDMTDPETGDAATSGWKTLSFTTKNPCAAPTNLAVSDITAESATLSWTAGYQETEWTVKYKKSTDSEYTTETVSGTPSLTLSGLASNTVYNVQVFNCENYVSANFTTAAGIPLTEAFATTSAPTGWAKYSGLLSDVMGGTALTTTSSGWNFSTGNGVFDNHAKVNLYGTNCKYWLVTPTLLMENNVQLTFDLALTAYSGSNVPTPATDGSDDKFVVLISTDNMATWTILRQWDNAGSQYVLNNIACSAIGEAVAFDLSSYAGQSIAIAFYGESTVSNADNNLHIDNVSIDYIPACAKPTGLAASDVTAHEATITWTSDATAWQVQLDDEDPIDVEEATYTFENLDPETTYTAKVRANCSGTYSEWTTTVSFTTTIACPAPTALAVTPNAYTATFTWESFAGEWEVAFATDADAEPGDFIVGTVYDTASYTVNDLELDDYYFWVRANCGDVDGNSTWAGPASVHIGYCVPAPTSVDNNGISNVTFGMGDYIVNNDTPKATYTDYTSQIGAVQAGVEATIAITFKTGYTYNTYVWVDLDNSFSFEADEVVCYGESTNTNPTTLTLNFTIPADQTLGDFRLRIGSADSGLGSNPANANPCYTGSYGCFQDYTLRVLEAPSCLTPTDIAINYTGGLTAEVTWEGEAETYNIDVNGEVTEGVTSPYVLDSLELATTYAVKVQADCGEDGTSEWSNPVSFTTDLCLPENQCAIYYSFTDQYDDSWNGAYINIVDATTGKLLYELTMPDVDGPYEGSFNVCDGREIQFVWVSGSYPRECGYVFTHFGTTILEKATNSAAPDAGVFFTYEVNCTPDPCTVPYELMSSNVSYNQATLSWTGYSDTYYVQYRTAELRSGDWTEVTANTTTLDLTGLVSEATYEWQVRTDCDSIVEWSEIVTFTTQGLITWNNPQDWIVPDEEEPEDVIIPDNTTVLIPAGYTAYADEITIEGDGQIIIEEGGELIHSNEVPVVFQMNVDGYQATRDENPDNDGYRLIASPVYASNTDPASIDIPEAMLEGDYDLYYFDQTAQDGLEWINQKDEANNFTTLELMKGYLYANTENVFVVFAGQTLPTNINVSVDLVYEEGHDFDGWNLVGNPYTAKAYVGGAFYKLNDNGDEVIPAELGEYIAPMKGFFVQASATGETCTISTRPQNNQGSLNINLSQANTLTDRAILNFGEGKTLGKFQLNPNHTKVYIPQDGKDYAMVSASNEGEMPVSFKAEKNGNYTLSFSNENVEFGYLRLIDNLTGVETDLLETPSYTFNARTTDYANRFRLVFATSSNDGDSFAYFNNGNLVINNEGQATLQVVDVMGRILRSESINGCASIINGNDVKVQKVVIE